jgi:hypothetical protein
MAAEEAAEESDAAADLRALERDVGGLALDDAGDGEDDDAGSLGSVDDEETPADATLSLQMVCAKNLPPDSLRDEAEDAESLASAVERLEHVRLDRCGLVSLLPLPGDGGGDPASTASESSAGPDSVNATTARALSFRQTPLLLGSLRNVSSLYLQKNRLVSLGGAVCAETTPKLRFLALSDNALNDTTRDDDSKTTPASRPGDVNSFDVPRLLRQQRLGKRRVALVHLAVVDRVLRFFTLRVVGELLVPAGAHRLLRRAETDRRRPVTRLERREACALLGDEGEDGDEEESELEWDGDGDGDDFGEDFGDRKTPHGFVLEKTPRSNPSAAAAAAAALAMADDDAFDETLEPTTEASLASELAELERETRAVRAALDANDGDGDVFFSSPPAFAKFDASHRPARLLEKDRAANRAAARLEETRDALVDVEARVRHAKKRISLQASAEEGGGVAAAEATPSDDDGTKR